LKIVVTGSLGQLGKAFKSLSATSQHEFMFTDRVVLDITNPKEVEHYFNTNQVDFVINCAAYTAVDKAEEEREKAFLINKSGVENLVTACEKFGIALIHFSTDYVFDGENNKPYNEADSTNPLGVYGESKLEGEKSVLDSTISALVLRTSWLYATDGKNFYNTMLRLGKDKTEISVVSDQVGTPTKTIDLAEAVVHCIEKFSIWKGSREVYHFSNEGVASWYDFAKAILEINTIDCKVNPISTEEYPTPAKRPFFSVLNKQKFKTTFDFEIKHWREALLP